MIDDAERRGVLKPGGVIIEPTSGNTGIGLAMAAAVKGYRCILVMPESMSVERRRVMAAYGAELVLTPKEIGTKGAIEKAKEIVASTPGAWIPNQFDNPANVDIHRRTTAQEILKDFPDGIDYLITGVGTGGHITGVGEVLKKTMPNLKAFAVEPVKSSVIAGGTHSPHKIQGIAHRLHPGQRQPRRARRHGLRDGGGRVRDGARAPRRRRGSSSASRRAPRSPPWRRSSPRSRRAAACSPSATTRASGICRSRGCSRRRRERAVNGESVMV